MEGETPSLIATWIKIGIITATTGVLFMIAEARMTKPNSMITVSTGWVEMRLETARDMISSAPVLSNPPMIRNMKAMVQGAALDSTPAAALTGNRPSSIMTAAEPMATTSGGCFSRMN